MLGTSRGPIVEMDHVKKVFSVGEHEITVFSDLTLKLYAGEFLTLLGPSGCGKTTLLRMLAGLDTDYEGTIRVRGAPPGDDEQTALVFQESRLLPWYDVRTNIRLAVRTEGRESRRQAARLVDKALEEVGLDDDFRGAWPRQLSGGMNRRVALARALVNRPRLLLLDEPFAALDMQVRHSLQEMLEDIHWSRDIRREREMSTIMVTHDLEEAVYLSDTVLVLTPMPSNVFAMPFKVGLPSRPRQRDRDDFIARCADLFEIVVRASSEPVPF